MDATWPRGWGDCITIEPAENHGCERLLDSAVKDLACVNHGVIRPSRAIVTSNSEARVEPEIPRNAPRCRSCSVVICGKRTLSSARTSTDDSLTTGRLWSTVLIRSTDLRGAAAFASAKAPRSIVVTAASRLPVARRRRLIPYWEHRTLRVPKVHPISLAISAALRPLSIRLATRASAAFVKIGGFDMICSP